MKKIIFAILAISVLALGAVFVTAQKGETNKGKFKKDFGGRGGGFGRMAEKLNLSDEQKAQIKQITEAEKTKVEPIFAALKENHQKLEDLTADGSFDEAKVQALATEQGTLSAQLIVEKERTKSQIFQILTPEQREQAKQLKENMKDKFKDGFKRRGDKKNSDTSN
ncbi:MAG: Spy/CpxP family protein refolding chaperone [Pyrinomonadaceae bacterium]